MKSTTRSAAFNPNISDDLLSAYLDGQITPAERQLVEQALRADAVVQGRLQDLQATVQFLRQAPRISVPRAFVLSEAQVLAAGGRVKGRRQPGLWEQLFPRLMPLATATVAVLLIVVLGLDFGRPQLAASPTAAPAVAESAVEAPVQAVAPEATAVMGEVAKAAAVTEAPVAMKEAATVEVAAASEMQRSVSTAAPSPTEAEAPAAQVETEQSAMVSAPSAAPATGEALAMGAEAPAPTPTSAQKPVVEGVVSNETATPVEAAAAEALLADAEGVAVKSEGESETVAAVEPAPAEPQPGEQVASAPADAPGAGPVAVASQRRVLGLPSLAARLIEIGLAVLLVVLLILTLRQRGRVGHSR